MIEVKILLDDIDYDALITMLLPLAADKMEEKGGVLRLLGKNRKGLSAVAQQLLKTMSQEKRDEFLLQLLQEKRSTVLKTANEKAAAYGAGVKVLDIAARRVD